MIILDPTQDALTLFCEIPAIAHALVRGSVRLESHVVKKNGRPIRRNRYSGQPFIGKSSRLVDAEMTLEAAFAEIKPPQPITDPVWALFWFEFEQSWAFTKKTKALRLSMPDLSNLLELPQDCLQSAGVLANDNLIHGHDFSRIVLGHETRLFYALMPATILPYQGRL